MEIIVQSACNKDREEDPTGTEKIVKHTIIGICVAGQHIAKTGSKKDKS